uniref:Uncharacterized protein n=1 Tax=Anguilla anguilla TaxID=7936 RepID=A0A0E9VD54_ANGAN
MDGWMNYYIILNIIKSAVFLVSSLIECDILCKF